MSLAIEGGEPTKSYHYLQNVLGWLLDGRVDRKSVLFVVGGGVVGDLGGFAASVVLRGIPFVQVPTTLLAQVDSSVGGKTGINTPQGKNLIGSFYQPISVLCNTDTLKTLPERELKAGYAEIVKYGVLGDADFYGWLEANGKKILSLDTAAVTEAVERSCAAKARIVGRDEREQAGGDRALLNFGHTFAHALEAAAGYDGRLLHGEAVSIGMVMAAKLCVKMGLCPGQDATRIENHLKAMGLKTSMADIEPRLTQSPAQIADLMHHDKKASSGKIGFILIRGIGQAFQSFDVSMADVIEVIRSN
jgi:3-dehydroquinate synthase